MLCSQASGNHWSNARIRIAMPPPMAPRPINASMMASVIRIPLCFVLGLLCSTWKSFFLLTNVFYMEPLPSTVQYRALISLFHHNGSLDEHRTITFRMCEASQALFNSDLPRHLVY